ncbi:MAG: hypothetical protein HY717_24205 [Planctomycetes bacterium]|nr:hypothetical protein [Planctomycetota bacterium]
MTGRERSSNDLRLLCSELAAELLTVETLVSKAREQFQKVEGQPGEMECMAFAGYLHHFYTGLEGIFERISLVFEGSLPEGSSWHRDLKKNMGLEIPKVRPAVLSAEVVKALDEFLGFRHIFRHAYGIDLEWDRLKALLQELTKTFDLAKKDLIKFLDYLKASAEELE